MKLLPRLEKIIPLIRNIFIPALLFAAALFGYYLNGSISSGMALTLHGLFYFLSFTAFMTLLYFNQSQPVFFILCSVLCYVIINVAKNKYGTAFLENPAYQNLCLFAPLNFALFYFLPNRRLLKRHNIYFLLAVFIQYAVAEHLSKNGISLNSGANNASGLSGLAFWIFTIALLLAFARIAVSGRILPYAMFFSLLCIFFGFCYSPSASALTVFFCAGILILLIAVIQNLYELTYKDHLTGLPGRNSYIIHARSFPLKYSIGIVSIDDFDKLGINLGQRHRNILTKLIASRILEYEKEENVYRYGDDEFVIIFRNHDKNESFEQLENIRRAVASASFCFNPRRKALKLTVSAAVSEKKRSDATSFEVLLRTRKVLQKTRSFSHNVTTKA